MKKRFLEREERLVELEEELHDFDYGHSERGLIGILKEMRSLLEEINEDVGKLAEKRR